MKMFFAILYNFYYKNEDKFDAHFTALFYISLITSFNIISILYILEYIFPRFHYGSIEYIVSIIIVFIINYFLLIYKKKHLKIREKYKNLKKKMKILYKILFLLYTLVSIIILFYVIRL